MGRNPGPSASNPTVTALWDKSAMPTTAKTSTKINPYDRGFTIHLLDHNILPLEYDPPDGKEPEPPDNMREIEADIGAARGPEPAEDFQLFRKQYRRCSNEDAALQLLDTLEGDSAALLQSHLIRQKQMMSNLAPLTDGNMSHGSPDRAYGAAATELHRSVRQRLEGVVVPTGDKDFICPNFVVHAKSDSGSMKVARGQAAYDGALAARGMQALWDFGDGPPDAQAQAARVARTITCTWAFGVLKMYATHREPDSEVPPAGLAPREFPTYVSSLIGSWIMTDEEDQFLRGLTAYRNGLDWAKRQRDEVIGRANARARAEEA
jgi:hypothetical protein